jgi:hypothetical protein
MVRCGDDVSVYIGFGKAAREQPAGEHSREGEEDEGLEYSPRLRHLRTQISRAAQRQF